VRFLFAVAWRNLWRHRRRSLITAVAMGVAVALCMATIAIDDGAFEAMFDVMVEQGLGHAQVHHPDYPTGRVLYDTLPDATRLLGALDGQPGTVAASGRLNGFALVGGARESAGAMLVGVDPPRERRVSILPDRLVAGTWLPDEPARAILLGKGLAEEIEVGVGDEVVAVTQAADGTLGNELYRVVGIYRSGNTAMDRAGAYLHLADLQALLVLPDQVHQITLLTDDAEHVGSYVAGVRSAVATDTVEVQAWWEASPYIATLLDMRNTYTFIILGVIFVVAAFGVFNTMLMSVFERTRELGVLKALGLRPRSLVGLVVIESAFLATLACAAGLVLGALLDWYLVVYGLDFSGAGEEGITFSGMAFDPVFKGLVRLDGILVTLAAVFAVSILASLWPAFRAARLLPVEAIRTE